jgi:hypothetical protein
VTKRRPYPKDVQAEVAAADRENREVQLSDDQLAQLGHRKRNPIEVMRLFCVQCMGGNRAEVRRCTAPGCALFPYRLGKNPFTDRKGRTSFAALPVGSPIQDESGAETANSTLTTSEGAAE